MTARAADADTTHSLSARAKTLTEDVRTNTRHATRPDTQRRTCGAVACARHDRTHAKIVSVISLTRTQLSASPPAQPSPRHLTRFYLFIQIHESRGWRYVPPHPNLQACCKEPIKSPKTGKTRNGPSTPNANRYRFLFQMRTCGRVMLR